MTDTPTQRFIQSLYETNCEEARQSGDGFTAKCPAHADKNPSLSISEGEDGKCVIFCHAGCEAKEIVEAVGLTMADLFPNNSATLSTLSPKSRGKSEYRRRRRRQSNENKEGKVFWTKEEVISFLDDVVAKDENGVRSAQHIYLQADRSEVGGMIRYNLPTPETEKPKKTFRPIVREGDCWVIGGMKTPRPLYQLPDVIKADRVYIVEGEKAADALQSLGLTATTSAHGAKSPEKTDWAPLAGKDTVQFPDNDNEGEKYADTVKEILGQLSPSPIYRVTRLPDLPDKGDVADYVEGRRAAGLTDPQIRQEIEQFVEKIPPVRRENTKCPSILSYQPFPTHVLPEPIRGFVFAGAKAIGCDPSYLALPLMVVLATSIGHTRRLRLKSNWTCSTCIWAAVIGESGDKKTPPMEMAVASLVDREFKAGDRNDEAMDQYKREMAEWKKDYKEWERKKNTTDAPPQEPKPPMAERYVIDDVTTEGVTPLMNENPRGVLLYKDELKAWFGSFDRYVNKKGGDDAFWLKVFNNKSVIVDRKTSGTVRAREPFICIIGGIQPGTLRRALCVDHLESGMAARLLLAWPPSLPRKWTDAEIPEQIHNAVAAVIERLFKLEAEVDENGRPKPVFVQLTQSAREMFIRYYNDHADEMAELAGELKAAWAKLEEYAARLALVIHFARWAANDPTLEADGKVDSTSMTAGIVLTEWFKNEAKRVYSMLSESDHDRELRQLVEWIRRKGGSVTLREVQQGHRRYSTAQEAETALKELRNAGYGDWGSTESGRRGRPTRRFILSDVSTVYGNAPKAGKDPNTVDVDAIDQSENNEDDWGQI